MLRKKTRRLTLNEFIYKWEDLYRLLLLWSYFEIFVGSAYVWKTDAEKKNIRARRDDQLIISLKYADFSFFHFINERNDATRKYVNGERE